MVWNIEDLRINWLLSRICSELIARDVYDSVDHLRQEKSLNFEQQYGPYFYQIGTCHVLNMDLYIILSDNGQEEFMEKNKVEAECVLGDYYKV